MSKRGHGALSRTNLEWGSKTRKEEDKLRGLRGRARRENIEEGLAEVEEESAQS